MGPKKKKKVCLENFFSIVSIIQHSILWVWMMKIENKILYFQIIKYELQWQNGKKIKFVGPFFPSFFLSFLFFLLQTHSTMFTDQTHKHKPTSINPQPWLRIGFLLHWMGRVCLTNGFLTYLWWIACWVWTMMVLLAAWDGLFNLWVSVSFWVLW